MNSLIERAFHLSEVGMTIRTEVLAGSITFFTLADIIFVQPTLLGAAGMDFGSVFVATCVASGVATLMMAFFPTIPSRSPQRWGTISILLLRLF
jgi:AGZA family xanthine/uracil permease-like MFS transporter